jgi:type IV secretory pathway VirD2 relaxase
MPADEREFRIRPQAPKVKKQGSGSRGWSIAFKTVMHYARMSRHLGSCGASGGGRAASRFRQRCAVRVTYSPNRISGQWRAHGKYISRDSAVMTSGTEPGFSATAESVDVADTLDTWQSARDERVFKLILSPEFGDRVDLQSLTREMMSRMETELSRKLEWCAVAHFNTEHPHVHVTLRGRADGRALRLDRAYIKFGIRMAAEDLCTAQLGYRTELDAVEAERREVGEQRFTSLDRIINRASENSPVSAMPAPGRQFMFALTVPDREAPDFVRVRQRHLAARLVRLQKMGLAEPSGPNAWDVRTDFGAVLRAMQRAQDRQRLLQVHGALLSDDRLPLVLTNPRRTPALNGRVLTHGEEDSGRQYLLLEGTDARIHFIYHTPEVSSAWGNGKLRPNAFVRFRRFSGVDGRPVVEIADLGDAEGLLRNKGHLRSIINTVKLDTGPPSEQLWEGWLGRYNAAIEGARAAIRSHQRSASFGREQ